MAHEDIQSIIRLGDLPFIMDKRRMPSNEWVKEVQALPPLAVDTIAEWVKLAAECIAECYPQQLTAGKPLYKIACREHLKDRAKALKKLKVRHQDVELSDWNVKNGLPKGDHIPADKLKALKAKLPSSASLKRGLRVEFAAYLRANMPPR